MTEDEIAAVVAMAVRNEREACALIADANAAVYEDAIRLNDGPQEDTYEEQCCAEEAKRIAYAIRVRT